MKKRILTAVLVLLMLISLLPAGYAANAGPDREKLFMSRMGTEHTNVLYIDDLSAGTVSFLSPEHEKNEPQLAKLAAGLKNVVQIVHSANCDTDFEAAFLLRDGTVTCSDGCGHYDHLRDVVKLSDCASYALLSDGRIVSTSTREINRVYAYNAVDVGGSYMNCFAVTGEGKVVPIESFLSQTELDEIGRWNGICSIGVSGGRVFGFSADGKVSMTAETKKELDRIRKEKDYAFYAEEGEYGSFSADEAKLLEEYYVDLTNDGYDEHVVVIPFDALSDYEDISHVTQMTKTASDSRKILVFSGLSGALIYTDVLNTTRQNRGELYIRNDSGRWYFLKHLYDHQLPGWSESLQMYDLTEYGDENHVTASECSMMGRDGNKDDEAQHDIILIEYDVMKGTGFPLVELYE